MVPLTCAVGPSHFPERMQSRLTEIDSIKSSVATLPAVERVNNHLAANSDDIHAVNYTIAAWNGGNEAFNYCNLDLRAPVYDGACVDAMPYTLTSDENSPFSCGLFPNGTALNAANCIRQIDLQLDCNAVCECIVEDTEAGTVDRGCSSER